jgi:hypothetical protein
MIKSRFIHLIPTGSLHLPNEGSFFNRAMDHYQVTFKSEGSFYYPSGNCITKTKISKVPISKERLQQIRDLPYQKESIPSDHVKRHIYLMTHVNPRVVLKDYDDYLIRTWIIERPTEGTYSCHYCAIYKDKLKVADCLVNIPISEFELQIAQQDSGDLSSDSSE